MSVDLIISITIFQRYRILPKRLSYSTILFRVLLKSFEKWNQVTFVFSRFVSHLWWGGLLKLCMSLLCEKWNIFCEIFVAIFLILMILLFFSFKVLVFPIMEQNDTPPTVVPTSKTSVVIAEVDDQVEVASKCRVTLPRASSPAEPPAGRRKRTHEQVIQEYVSRLYFTCYVLILCLS